MKDKKSLYLAVILGLFIIGIGFVTYFSFSSIKNNIFSNNEIILGDTVCLPKTSSWNYVANYTGDKTYSPPKDFSGEYSYGTKVADKSKCSGNNVNECYYVRYYDCKKDNSPSPTPTSDTKKNLGESCTSGTDCSSGVCSGGKCVCPAGKYKSGDQCVTCTEGHYCPGNNSQSNCDAGTSSSPGAKYANECLRCSDGYISSAGGKCTRCANGEKSNDDRTKCEKTSDTSYCNEGYYHENGSTSCTPCPAGKWSNGAKATTCYGCPTGSYCSGGTIKKCKAGTSSFNGASESDCKPCDKGYISSEGSYCRKCDDGYTSNSSHTSCYKPGGNNSTPTDKCYKDANNDYQVGNFNNQPGYTLVSNETKNCNNIKVKKVDSNKTVLTGAAITFTDSSVPPVTRTFNIGETDINMTNPGTYTIVETVAPTGYQIDNTPIQVIVNDDGTINVTGGTNIDLGTSNGTRNITLSIINNNGSTPEPTVEEYCYVKRGNGTNNEYCFGNTDTSCVGYSEVVSGRTRETCTEDIACYQKTDGTYTVGKFDGQFGYQYFGSVCPACYEDANGNYRWTNTPNANERPVAEINTIDKCVTPPKMSSKKIIYVVLIIIVAIAIFIVLKSLKKGNGNNNMSTEY